MPELCNGDINSIKVSTEATFCSNSNVNKQNGWYYTENPHAMMMVRTSFPTKSTYGIEILEGRVLSPYFLDGAFNTQRYLHFPQNSPIPTLDVLILRLREI